MNKLQAVKGPRAEPFGRFWLSARNAWKGYLRDSVLVVPAGVFFVQIASCIMPRRYLALEWIGCGQTALEKRVSPPILRKGSLGADVDKIGDAKMPIYEYQCQACQHGFEKLQKISDAALVECPECHKPELKKKISAAGFRLSGSGWYETDFKKDGKKKNLMHSDTAPADGKAAKGDDKKSSDSSTSNNNSQGSGGPGKGGKTGGSAAAAKE